MWREQLRSTSCNVETAVRHVIVKCLIQSRNTSGLWTHYQTYWKKYIQEHPCASVLCNIIWSLSRKPFWISQEPFMWPWCNLAAGQRRPYCASMNSHSPMGLVDRQWDAVDWACVLCYRCIHTVRATRSANLRQCTCPFYSSYAGFYGKTFHCPGLSVPLQPKFGSLRLLVFPKAKFAVENKDICECDGHTVHKLSQWHLTAHLVAPEESDYSWMCSKVSSDWLPSYIKATWPVLEIFKMAGYSPDKPGINFSSYISCFFPSDCNLLQHIFQQKYCFVLGALDSPSSSPSLIALLL